MEEEIKCVRCGSPEDTMCQSCEAIEQEVIDADELGDEE